MHALLPFAPTGDAGIAVAARAERRGSVLILAWRLDDPHARAAVPAAAATPARRDRLWERTCCEAFVAPAEGTAYWELNVAPSGDWNLYRFAAPREGMAVEARVAGLAAFARAAPAPGALAVAATLDLAPLGVAATALDVGLAAVVALRDGATSYWALRHVGERPDFHRRESFACRLAPPAEAEEGA